MKKYMRREEYREGRPERDFLARNESTKGIVEGFNHRENDNKSWREIIKLALG